MKKLINSEGLKELQISILKEVHNYCRDNDITYFIAYGTLLGAVRHKGYIPWDDDIDIIMPRPDYNKFVSSFSHKHLYCYNYKTNTNNLILFCKVCDNRTVIEEESNIKGVHFGVNIDVFPLDGLSSDKKIASSHVKRISKWVKLSELKKMTVFHKRAWYKNILLFFVQLFLIPIPYKMIVGRICSLMEKYDYDSSEYVEQLYLPSVNRILPKKVFQNLELMDFENCKFWGISDYDTYLKSLYGDYMKLPPVEKRTTKHFFEAYWK